MLCQSCSKRQATTHVKSFVNGEIREYHLCPECAQKMGYGNPFDNFGFSLGSLIGGLLGENELPERNAGELRCKRCGSTFREIAKTGQVGCAECYETFYDQMLPSIQRIHGNTTHVGKLAPSADSRAKLRNELERAKAQLQKAIEEQEFEKAAQLRDQIREMERQGEQHE